MANIGPKQKLSGDFHHIVVAMLSLVAGGRSLMEAVRIAQSVVEVPEVASETSDTRSMKVLYFGRIAYRKYYIIQWK